MKHTFIRKTAVVQIFSLLIIVVFPILFAEKARAGNLTQTAVRLDRLAASTATGGTVCAKPTTVGTEASVKVTFPTGFTVNITASNWTVTTTNLPFGGTAWPGVGTASSVSGQDVTFPSLDLTVGTLYCFNFSGTSTLTTSTAGNNKTGVVTVQASGPSTIDSGAYALSIVSNDQVVISATVPATFTFALSANTDLIGTLSTTTASSTGITATVVTNAASGWTVWVKSANAALNSTSTSASIATAGSIDATPSDLASTTGYVLDVNITTQGSGGSGNFTIEPEYDGANTTSGGTLSTSFQAVAVSDNPAGPTDGDVMTIIERAKINAVQAAATDYTDTLTVVAAGLF